MTINSGSSAERHRFDRSWADDLRLIDGTPVWWRVIVPTDRPSFERWLETLSKESLVRRFHVPFRSLPDEMWEALLNDVDQKRHIAIALHRGADIVGTCHLIRSRDDWHTADVAVTVTDVWQGKGAGGLMAREILGLAGDVRHIDTSVLQENRAARMLLARLGSASVSCANGTCRVRVALAPARGGKFRP